MYLQVIQFPVEVFTDHNPTTFPSRIKKQKKKKNKNQFPLMFVDGEYWKSVDVEYWINTFGKPSVAQST